jgi:error-prone DNA polymerase
VAKDFAGFAPGRAEKLRRALGSKFATEAVAAFHTEFVEGAMDRGVEYKTAEKVWDMLKGFGGYAFSKAHAASFAAIAYWCAYLRLYYPVEYFTGLLRYAPLGSYPPRSLEAEARRKGIQFLGVDVNRSEVTLTIEGNAIRHGLSEVKSIGDDLTAHIVHVRGKRPFRSFLDFIQRTAITDRRKLEALILAGACDGFGDREKVLWELTKALEVATRPQSALPMFDDDTREEQPNLQPMSPAQKVVYTFQQTGYSVEMHLTELRRDDFRRAGCQTYAEVKRLRFGSPVKIGGMVMDGLRRPPSAGGLGFIRLEDSDGLYDVTVPIEVYERDWQALRHLPMLVVEGRLQRVWPMVTVVAARVVAV